MIRILPFAAFFLFIFSAAAQSDEPLTEARFRSGFLNRIWETDSTTSAELKNTYEDLYISADADTVTLIYLNPIEWIGANRCRYTHSLSGKWFEIQTGECDERISTQYIYGYFTRENRLQLCLTGKRLKMVPRVMNSQQWFAFSAVSKR